MLLNTVLAAILACVFVLVVDFFQSHFNHAHAVTHSEEPAGH